MTRSQTRRLTLALIVVISLMASQSFDTAAQESSDGSQTRSATDELALKQSHIADKYQRLEMLMLKMAEFDATSFRTGGRKGRGVVQPIPGEVRQRLSSSVQARGVPLERDRESLRRVGGNAAVGAFRRTGV